MRRPFHWPAAPAVAHSSRSTALTQDCPRGARPFTSKAAWSALRRTVAEALILQAAAEDLLVPDPADAARACGRLARRFAELREDLPSGRDPEIDLYLGALDSFDGTGHRRLEHNSGDPGFRLATPAATAGATVTAVEPARG